MHRPGSCFAALVLAAACGGSAPSISAFDPSSATAGGPAFTLAVTGSAFASGAQLEWNGAPRPTSFVSASRLTADIAAADIAAAGNIAIAVKNADGRSSAPMNFAVNNPAPSPAGLSPSSTMAGGPAFVLTVNGSGFVAASQVLWNGSARPTTFVSASQLTAAIAAADIAEAAPVGVSVQTPAPGGGTSSPVAFALRNPAPVIGSLQPPSAAAGSSAFTLVVQGTGFVASTQITWNGSAVPTAFVSATQVTASVPAAFVAFPGSAAVVATNPAPGGGTSGAGFAITGSAPANARFVAPGGSDTNAGSIDQPFATIQKCASTTGATCAVRAGNYRETVTPASNTTIVGYDGEVATVDGSDPVTGWTVWQGSVWRANATLAGDGDTDQVFAGGEMMIEARWPTGGNLFRPAFARTEAGTAGSTLVDSHLPAADWTGARLWLWSGDDPWEPMTGTVTASQSGQISYSTDGAWLPPYIQPEPGAYYYLSGVLAALGAPGEWVYRAGALYLWAPKGADPNGLVVRAKKRQLCFDLSGRRGVTLRNLALFACTVKTDSSSSADVLDGLDARYVSHFTKLIDFGGHATSYWYWHVDDTGIILHGNGNTLENSRIGWSAGDGVAVNGTNHVVRNNLIHHFDYAANYCSGISLQGSGHAIQHNTIRTGARFTIFASSIDNYPYVSPDHLDVSYNDSFDAVRFSRDAGHFYFGGGFGSAQPDVSGSRIHHNWFHGAVSRYPGPADNFSLTGIYFDEDGAGWEVDQNVLWNNAVYNIFLHGSTSGVTAPNDNRIHNNTIPDVAATSYIYLNGISDCGTTSVNDNLVLRPVVQDQSHCSASNNGPTAAGATDMTAAVQVGCNLPGCATHPPPAISAAGVAASIAADPDSLQVASGAAASFTAMGAGTPPLSYQWQRDGIDIPGATSATYSLSAAGAQDDGAAFTVRVTNALGSQTSDAATLTVE